MLPFDFLLLLFVTPPPRGPRCLLRVPGSKLWRKKEKVCKKRTGERTSQARVRVDVSSQASGRHAPVPCLSIRAERGQPLGQLCLGAHLQEFIGRAEVLQARPPQFASGREERGSGTGEEGQRRRHRTDRERTHMCWCATSRTPPTSFPGNGRPGDVDDNGGGCDGAASASASTSIGSSCRS